MKILHVISSIRYSGGGPARSVQGLSRALENVGVDSWILAIRSGESPWIANSNKFLCQNLKSSFNPNLSIKLRKAFEEIKPDLIHFNGIWQWNMHRAVCVARRLAIPYVISPRGMLEPRAVAHHQLRKMLALWLYQRQDLLNARAIHATAEPEALHVRGLGIDRPIILQANGVNFPSKLPSWNLHFDGFHRVLFLSRIHRTKGLMELIKAWSLLRPSGWKVEIVGTDANQYQDILEQEVYSRGLQGDFIFTGPLDDIKKWEAYRRADLFVLPSYSENFGIVIAEALYAGVPVITTTGTPWESLNKLHCGWWIEGSVDMLRKTLEHATSIGDKERKEMGDVGHRYVQENFSWKSIALDFEKDYKNILSGNL